MAPANTWCELDLGRLNMPDSRRMKKMRCLFLFLAAGFGLCAERAHAQTTYQIMNFGIICQFTTNYLTLTNPTTQVVTHYIEPQTVFMNSANLVKDMAIDLMGTTNWARWTGASIVYEVNLATGNQGIYMRLNGRQTNVSQYFSTNFTNLFSQNASNVFSGTNYATSLPLGGDNNDQSGLDIMSSRYFGNLAYLTFSTSNNSFALFGYSQGPVALAEGSLDGVLYQRYLPRSEIVGAGTFSPNIYFIPTTTGSPPDFYNGVAHGTVFVQVPHFIPIGPPEGP